MSAQQRYSMEALPELLDHLPQVVHVLLDDPQGFLGTRRLGPWQLLTRNWLGGLVHGPDGQRRTKRAIELNQRREEDPFGTSPDLEPVTAKCLQRTCNPVHFRLPFELRGALAVEPRWPRYPR